MKKSELDATCHDLILTHAECESWHPVLQEPNVIGQGAFGTVFKAQHGQHEVSQPNLIPGDQQLVNVYDVLKWCHRELSCPSCV